MVNPQINSLDVELIKVSPLRIIWFFSVLIISILAALGGFFLLSFGVFGVLLALFDWYAAYSMFMDWAIPKQHVHCPLCNDERKIIRNVKNFKCKKCRNLIVVNWH